MDKLRGWLSAPQDIAGLAAFRILFGLLVFVSTVRFAANGWVDRFFVQPRFFFKYWGFEWVQAWPAWGMYLHVAVVALLALCVAAGLFYRVTSVLLFVAFTYLELIDVSLYLNHYYLVSLLSLLLACMPAHRAASVDAWRKPSIRSQVAPRWCLGALRCQVATVYLFAGLAKVSADWLLHGQPLGIWLSAHSEAPLIGGVLDEPWLALAMSWGGFVYDTTIWLWLSMARTRRYAYVAVVVFHACVGWLLNIGMFPLIMIVAATVFFSPSWPRRLLRRRGGGVRPPIAAASGGQHTPLVGMLALALLALVQLALPLRHLAYGGNSAWHEQGMRWAWRVVVREKNGAVTYLVTLPDGRRRIVTPGRYLTNYQERELSTQPDLIVQLAHHIADDFEQRGLGPVAVRADVVVSLNGRASARLIDPDVDLTRIQDGIADAPWILPAPQGPPIRLRPFKGLALRSP